MEKQQRKQLQVTGFYAWVLALGLLIPAAGQQLFPAAVTVGDHVVLTLRAAVGSFSPADRAAIVNARIQRVLNEPEFRPSELALRRSPDGSLLLALPDLSLLEVSEADAAAAGTSQQALAEEWRLRLRDALTEAQSLGPRPEKGHEVSFLPLLLVSLLAFLIPLGLSRFRRFPVPVVVGEILAGIVIGRSGFGLVHYGSWLQFLAEFGFAFLMFLSGLEVDLSLLEGSATSRRAPGSWRTNPTILAVVTFGLTLLLAALFAAGLSFFGLVGSPWMVLLLLSTTSLGMVVPVLKERGIALTPFGQTLLMAALVADFVTMFLITIVAGLLSSGPTLNLFLSLTLIGVFVVALRLGRRLTRVPTLTRILEELAHATTQLQVRGSLALLLVFVALSEGLGTEVILGAFLAGVLLSLFEPKEGSDLRHKLEALGFGFFIPVFFVMVGVRFDLARLATAQGGLLLAVTLIIAAFTIKIGAAFPLRWIASRRETLAGGLLLSSRLSLIIAAAEIGLRLGLFTQSVHAAAICVALVTCFGGPLGFQLLMPALKRRRQLAVIAGETEHGGVLAERLRRQSWEVALLETSVEDAADLPDSVRARAIEADLARKLTAAGAEEAEVVVAATSSDAVNEAVCHAAESFNGPRIVALARKEEVAERVRTRGFTAVTPALSTLFTLEGMVTHPAVFRLLVEGTADKRIAEVPLYGPGIVGKQVREVTWPGDVLLLSLQREEEILVPDGSTRLQTGDRLTVFGTESFVDEAVAQINPSRKV